MLPFLPLFYNVHILAGIFATEVSNGFERKFLQEFVFSINYRLNFLENKLANFCGTRYIFSQSENFTLKLIALFALCDN